MATNGDEPRLEHARRVRRWYLLLALPLIGLLYPPLYAKATPKLWGFPFFYWYQFAWVPVAALLTYFVYTRTRR
jgi:Protein of unknown function (DUF3311)